ncbi:IS5 family transposase [Methylobacterium isbiliense]|uniref:IS5 family transposase ISAtu2 n=1 Tax=Methylobacterium isbiliense TaxID=315478 RepID=A0ABQ4SHB2_9HYPH|nr:IS5 family transposase [Methylobacterium isbiliense]MDN3625799.1 IS5 family transposase [Methylobacterium isbiliense]GJE02549.1 IS5 family transposase ISAtu2 [Methylobacterium isbiliense]
MARRQIGQEQLALGAEVERRSGSLDEIAALIDWSEIDRVLAPIYAAPTGEQAWPPLALFKGLLLAVWYDLSDVKLAEALDDRTSFRRFCGFAAHEPTPERTAFVRFRRELVARGLDGVLFETVTRQLDARGMVIKTGTLVDATVIASATSSDAQARWVGHRHRAAVHGDKAHVACDHDGGIVRTVAITPANVNDGRMLGAVLPASPGEVYADLAYASVANERAIHAAGGHSRLPARGIWAAADDTTALACLEAWNWRVGHVRRRIEKIFGTWKRSDGLRRMRWWGLAKAGLQVRLTATAYTLRRAMTLLRGQPA